MTDVSPSTIPKINNIIAGHILAPGATFSKVLVTFWAQKAALCYFAATTFKTACKESSVQ